MSKPPEVDWEARMDRLKAELQDPALSRERSMYLCLTMMTMILDMQRFILGYVKESAQVLVGLSNAIGLLVDVQER